MDKDQSEMRAKIMGVHVTRSQQRAALVGWALARGMKLTTAEIAKLVGLSPRAAREMMAHLAEVLPIKREKRVWSAKDKEP